MITHCPIKMSIEIHLSINRYYVMCCFNLFYGFEPFNKQCSEVFVATSNLYGSNLYGYELIITYAYPLPTK